MISHQRDPIFNWTHMEGCEHFLTIDGLNRELLTEILDTAESFRRGI